MGSAAAAGAAAKGGFFLGRKLRAKRDAREAEHGTRSRIKAKRDQREADTGHRSKRGARKSGRTGRLQAQADVTRKMGEAGVAYGKRRGVERAAIERQMAAQMGQFAPMRGQMEKMYGGGGYKTPDYKSAINGAGPGGSRPDKPKKKGRARKKTGKTSRAGGIGAAIARSA